MQHQEEISQIGRESERPAIHRSRWLIDDFRLLRPRSIAEALAYRRDLGAACAFMAGGVDIVNRLKFGGRLDHLIYLPAIPGLGEIVETPDALVIGCLVTHRTFAESPAVSRHFPELPAIWTEIANIRVRHKGTLAGNLMAGKSEYEAAPVLGALGAQLQFEGPGLATTVMPVERLSATHGSGAHLLRTIRLPIRRGRRISYSRDLRPALTLALAVDIDGDRLLGGGVGIGGAHEQPVILPLAVSGGMTAGEKPSRAPDIAAATLETMPEPRTDHNASSAYRRRMAAILLRRALAAIGNHDA